jgi:hypothetical protein
MTSATTGLNFTARQMIVLTLLGIAFWFAGAMILRMAEPMGAYQGTGRAVLYAAIAIGTVPFVPLTRMIAGLRPGQIAAGVAWVTASAMACDGLALPLVPALYGDTAGAGAAILWGAAMAVFLGFAFDRAAAS